MTMPAPSHSGPPSDRVRVRRTHQRGHYDRETILRILDDGLHCHIGFIVDGGPVVIPTMYWHDADHLYFHGSRASRMMRTAEGQPVCVTVTHLDGLVLARSAFHHSANYRSVTLFGMAEPVEDAADCMAQLESMMERLVPGRWHRLRPVSHQELKATRILRVSLAEASAKIRAGPPAEDAEDLGWPIWAGLLPLQTMALSPQADAHVTASCPAPNNPLPGTASPCWEA
jgi:nitroimidazol reductase NimA-like FMN-containing flavoprotein (pyridoxamine 5'-phosphate oxidase superfamily)